MIIADLVDLFMADRAQYCANSTLGFYRAMLAPFAKWAGAQELHPDLIKAYIAEKRDAGRASETLANIYRATKVLSSWAYDEGHIEVRPFEGRGRVKAPRRTQAPRPVLSDEDIIALLKAPGPARSRRRSRWSQDGPRRREQLQTRAAVALLIDSAIRSAELCRLNCGDVRGTSPVMVAIKGGRVGHVLMSPPTRALLHELAGERADDEPLFLGWLGSRLTSDGLRNLMERAAARAGITLPSRPIHAFRHWSARAYVRAGLSDSTVQRILNHASVVTTQRVYIRDARSAKLEAEHAAASPITRLLGEADTRRPWAKATARSRGRRRRSTKREGGHVA